MKISKLIERLGELQGEHGDIEVRLFAVDHSAYESAEGAAHSLAFFPKDNFGRPEHVEISTEVQE